MFKKCFHLCLFISLIFLLFLVLYYTEGPAIDKAAEDLNGGGGIDDQSPREMVNFHTLIYSLDKDPAIRSELQASLKPEPEPEPEPAPPVRPADSGQAETGTGRQTGSDQVSASTSQKEQQMVNYINEARQNAGLPALQVDNQLTVAARAKSKDMVDHNYFSHNSPTYGSFTGLLQHFGISYRAAAENIAMNSNGNVDQAHNSLMNSPGHRSNILGQSFNSVGVGIYVKSDGSHYYTQLFVGR